MAMLNNQMVHIVSTIFSVVWGLVCLYLYIHIASNLNA
jgi:hypothetical protein